jgi:hypothetical protein
LHELPAWKAASRQVSGFLTRILAAVHIGLEPLVRPEIPALTAARLAWVQQNYIRAETLIRANARLVTAQAPFISKQLSFHPEPKLLQSRLWDANPTHPP